MFLKRLTRLARNVALDLRYGAWVGGAHSENKFRNVGANDPNNSDYRTLDRIFADVLPGLSDRDVLVDVGCGWGRVINWWLSRGIRNRIIGIEIDPDIAGKVAHRLRRHANVEIVSTDATQEVPPDATLFYLFNPFTREAMERFRDAVLRSPQADNIVLVYYAPEEVDVFENDSRFSVSRQEIDDDTPGSRDRHRRFAIVRTTGVSGAD